MRSKKEKLAHITELAQFHSLFVELKAFFENPQEHFKNEQDTMRLLDLKIKILEQYFPFNSLFSDTESPAFRMLEFCRVGHVHDTGLGQCGPLLEDCAALCVSLEDYKGFLEKA